MIPSQHFLLFALQTQRKSLEFIALVWPLSCTIFCLRGPLSSALCQTPLSLSCWPAILPTDQCWWSQETTRLTVRVTHQPQEDSLKTPSTSESTVCTINSQIFIDKKYICVCMGGIQNHSIALCIALCIYWSVLYFHFYFPKVQVTNLSNLWYFMYSQLVVQDTVTLSLLILQQLLHARYSTASWICADG